MINTNARNAGDGLENVVMVRGGGDLASGTIHRLYRSGYRLLVLECENRLQSEEWFRFARQFMMDSLQWKGFFAGR